MGRADKMPIKFTITQSIAKALMRIEAAKQAVSDLPIHPGVLSRLRHSARLDSTHYSTQIEGNRLTQEQVDEVLVHQGHFAGRDRDEQEVKGYYAALAMVEDWASSKHSISQERLQRLHGLVMGGGRTRVKPTPYRDGQNVIRDGATGNIVYLPPESKEVSLLMGRLVDWVGDSDLPAPLIAGLAHYQYATIHPYYDGNGRTARLLTTLILHLGGYDLQGIYSLEEYYARDLPGYYRAISIGPYNYYMGRPEADVTPWLEYFCKGMATSFSRVEGQARMSLGCEDQSPELRRLDARQRRALDLFLECEVVTAKQVAQLFGFQSRSSALLCSKWVQSGFLEVVDPSKRGRRYRLADRYSELVQS